MSMHLHHPALSLNGHRKGKVKFASAEAKRKQEDLKEQWDANMKQWKAMSKPGVFKPAPRSAAALQPRIPPGRESPVIPSLDTGHKGAVSTKAPQVYTGTKMIGIGTLHKSNAVPVFSDEEAKAISAMRR